MGGKPPAGALSRAASEIAVVAGTAALALHFSPRLPGGAGAWLAPAVLLYVPLAAILLGDRDFSGCGLSWPERGAPRDFLGFVLAVMPVFLAGYYLFARYYLGQGFEFRPWSAAALAELAFWQVLGVALPEEVFFRGWLQGRLNRMTGLRFRLWGARVGPGLFIAAAVFAGFHLFYRPSASRLLVFFPGLLFGLYRERTKSVVVPVLVHAAANFLFLIAQDWMK